MNDENTTNLDADADVDMHDTDGSGEDTEMGKKSAQPTNGGLKSSSTDGSNGNDDNDHDMEIDGDIHDSEPGGDGESRQNGAPAVENKHSQHHSVTLDDEASMNSSETDGVKNSDKGASTKKHLQGEIKTEKTETMNDAHNTVTPKKNTNGNGNSSTSATPPVLTPLLKGTLSFIDNELTRKHIIRGMWNFENTSDPPQRFDLARILGPDEDCKELPKDGEFRGSFGITYKITTSKGKEKVKKKTVVENGVNISFTKQEGKKDAFDMNGQGVNEYGVFDVYGTAVRDDSEGDKKYKVELRKRYVNSVESAPTISSTGKKVKSKSKKRKLGPSSEGNANDGPLPDPSPSFPTGVVCLRGKLQRDSSVQEGVVHKISGLWSTGLDLILADPKNEHGLCNRFEYEHKGSAQTDLFPISGRYTGYFIFSAEQNESSQRIPERDVTLKFKKNNAGYYNIEGKGSNAFGKYTITGTLDTNNILTFFRHFVPRKPSKSQTVAASSAKIQIQEKSPRMTLDDVDVPDQKEYEPIVAPADGYYQAVSRGTFKVNDDGVHSCTGKWAGSRHLHDADINTCNFHFGLEEHHAKLSAEEMIRNGHEIGNGKSIFPVDSENYKGSFKIKKGGNSVDYQIVMKFRKNTTGSYNVYGKGVNDFGTFDLIGSFFLVGPSSGSIELFRIYQPTEEKAAPQVVPQVMSAQTQSKGKTLPLAKNAKKNADTTKKPSTVPSQPAPSLIRRESSRQVKLPSRLEEDDPEALKTRLMEKCKQILMAIKKQDEILGLYFAEPVDAVAHNIPTYHQIITNPMDLGTVEAMMNADGIESPEEFARLIRLVFKNAIKFNSDPLNLVHQTARNLLTLFNQKFRDVERMMEKRKPTKAELKEMKRKQQKEEKEEKKREKERKRKRGDHEDEDPKSKQLALLQSSSEDIRTSLEALSSATSTGTLQSAVTVTRNEFSLMTNAVHQMQTHMIHMQTIIQLLVKPKGENSMSSTMDDLVPSTASFSSAADAKSTKKSAKRKKVSKPQAKPSDAEPFISPPPVPAPVAAPPELEEERLTYEEQEELTNAINELSEDKIHVVIAMIKDSKQDLVEEDQEIEISIEDLDTVTQRKLLKYARKNKPKPTRKGRGKTTKKTKPPPAPKEPEAPIDEAETKDDETGFKFGADSDSDSDDDDEEQFQSNGNANETNAFNITENNLDDDDDDDDSGDEDAILEDGEAAAWTNIAKPEASEAENNDSGDEDDDSWEAARGAIVEQSALDKERQQREKKILQEKKAAKEKSLAEAAEKNRKLQAQRKAKEEEEARKRDQKEKEEKERAQKVKDAALKDIRNTEQTVDLESQSRIMGGFMNEYEQSYMENDIGSGGASPGSDFGF
mmetsp:Transcript_6747/g.8542  ORF Transcript_6747/g.8542 Transcript_6747/m.8542 type:complete len:1363 (+) Transcript_6747:234-4322(+)